MTALRLLERRPAETPSGYQVQRERGHQDALRALSTAHSEYRVRHQTRARLSSLGSTQIPSDLRELNDSLDLAAHARELRRRRGCRMVHGEFVDSAWATLRGASLVKLHSGENLPLKSAAWALRDAIRLTHPSERSAACGWARVGEVGIWQRQEDQGGGYVVGGVETCSSVHDCPVCAMKIKRRRAEEIQAAVRTHAAACGGRDSMALLTFTIRHQAGVPLRKMLDGLQAAWHRYKSRVPTDDKIAKRKNRAHQNLREEYETIGGVYGLEVTHGENGWHPHRHEVLFFARDLSEMQQRELERRARAWWAECVEKEMGEEFRPDEHGVKLTTLHQSDYISKLGLEIADIGAKRGKDSHRNPWALYLDGARGDRMALELTGELSMALKGCKAIQFSGNLLKHLRALGWKHEPDDSSFADETIGATLVLEVPSLAWCRARRMVNLCELLETAESVGALHERLRALAGGAWSPKLWGSGIYAARERAAPERVAERQAIRASDDVMPPSAAELRRRASERRGLIRAKWDALAFGERAAEAE